MSDMYLYDRLYIYPTRLSPINQIVILMDNDDISIKLLQTSVYMHNVSSAVYIYIYNIFIKSCIKGLGINYYSL